MPVIEVCDECYAKIGTCNCYDWNDEDKDKSNSQSEKFTTQGEG